jgi:hypothetical protein
MPQETNSKIPVLAPSWNPGAEDDFLAQQYRAHMRAEGIPLGMVNDEPWRKSFYAGVAAVHAAVEESKRIARLRCMCFMSPGPPWYAAQCKYLAGHGGRCEFGTMEEAGARWNQAFAESTSTADSRAPQGKV